MDTDIGDELEKDGKDEPGKRSRKHFKPHKPSLIERFAKFKGYTKVDSDRFYHPDGSSIQKTGGNSFPWGRYSKTGELQQCYWAKDHCIEREPLQVEADVWELCDNHPDKYALLLTDPKGNPVEFSGQYLRELRNSGWLTLYPAKYCLVYEQEAGMK